MNSTQTTQTETAVSLPRLVGMGLLIRLMVDTGVQMFFPFQPIIAAGMGISAVALGRLVSLRSAMGLFSPIFGVIADQYGYRRTMQIGLMGTAVGMILVALSQSIWVAGAGMVILGIGTFAFTPTLQAYMSDQLPAERRARALALTEYSWALAGIVGLFLAGLLIEQTSWRAPFFILSGGLFIAAMSLGRLPGRATKQAEKRPISTPASFFALGTNPRSTWATILSGCLIMFSGFHLFISYGNWLFAEYNQGAAELGTIALIMGIADMAGSGIVSLIGDRFYKRHLMIAGALAGIGGYLLLPVMNRGLITAVIGLLIVRLMFEFIIVSTLVLMSEQAPAQRARAMTLGAAGALLGSTTAGFTGPLAYQQFGVSGLAFPPILALLFVIGLVKFVIQETHIQTVH